jgi:uncharacterized ion transporter superfamily protein YfcC
MDKTLISGPVHEQKEREKGSLNLLIILLGILMLVGAMTYFIESGKFERYGRLVIPVSLLNNVRNYLDSSLLS